VFVRSIQAPSPTFISIVKERRPWSISELSVSECVKPCPVWPTSMVCNDTPRDIPKHDPPRTYVCTHVRGGSHARTYIMHSAMSGSEWDLQSILKTHRSFTASGSFITSLWQTQLLSPWLTPALGIGLRVYIGQYTHTVQCKGP